MRELSTKSKEEIEAVYHELFCVATTISKDGVKVAKHLESYLLGE